MEIVISIAKIIVAILPFLTRKSRLKGKWNATYHRASTNEQLIELVELKQLWSLVWGTIKPVLNPKDPEWICYGLMRDQVLVGIYLAREKLRHWQGSFTLSLADDDTKLKGYYSGFEESTQTIVGSEYEWTKLA